MFAAGSASRSHLGHEGAVILKRVLGVVKESR